MTTNLLIWLFVFFLIGFACGVFRAIIKEAFVKLRDLVRQSKAKTEVAAVSGPLPTSNQKSAQVETPTENQPRSRI